MRLIIGLVALIVVVAIAAPIVRYGTMDPCRMLAQDIADESYGQIAKAMGAEPGETPEPAYAMARMMTSQSTQTDCMMQLKDRWLGLNSGAK
tara:strand:+ start:2467 stop:2742 length:276 start_codon:yes stop_codon:yes gene_type:complete